MTRVSHSMIRKKLKFYRKHKTMFPHVCNSTCGKHKTNSILSIPQVPGIKSPPWVISGVVRTSPTVLQAPDSERCLSWGSSIIKESQCSSLRTCVLLWWRRQYYCQDCCSCAGGSPAQTGAVGSSLQ